MLSHFSVKNYKCLADVSLPLTPIHVLIGQNDTGKTSLFEAIRIGCMLAERFGSDDDTPNQFSMGSYKHFISSVIRGRWDPTEILWADSDNFFFRLDIQRRMGTSEVKDAFAITMSTNRHSEIHSRFNATNIRCKSEIYRFRPSAMALASRINPAQKFLLDEDGFGLATLLGDISDYDPRLFLKIQDQFLKYFTQFNNIRLENTDGWERAIVNEKTIERPSAEVCKQVKLATKNKEFHLKNVSDGAIILLGFLALMHSPKPPDIILIEEPENGIHPKRLQEVVKLLKTFVSQEKNAPQIIMTTHSPYLLSEFQPEEVTLMRRQADGSAKAFPLRDAPHIRERMGNEFYLGELWYNLDEEELLK